MDSVAAGLQSALQGRYTIERQLGRGGMATVYLARDLRHDRPVALKVLHPDLAATLGPERFLREVRLTAQLQHPHILPVFDSGEAAGQLWYTMPYVLGESLRQRLSHEKQLPLEDALQIARTVLAALAHAHGLGIVHRDIKPENILLEAGEAVVADFGIARALAEAGGEPLTQTGMSVGTPAYMSPEQAMGGEVDGRSDLYSVGSVLYEMLAGEPPYSGSTPQAILAKRMLEPVPHLRTLRESVPEAVEQAVTKALAKTPADRFATAQHFAETLIPAPRPSGPARGWRRRVPALGLLVLLAGAGGFWVWRWRHPGPSSAGSKMVAVLPFENLGRSEDEYFADGLTEEITSRLAGVHGLGVISRTSSMQYKKTTKSLKQIGRELGVGYVLEGSVRWEKPPGGRSRIRVTPQLIEVANDRHLWAERYDAELVDVFEVQGKIAGEVTGALDLALREPERQALAAKPTDNLDAYNYFLRGNGYYDRSADPRTFETAIELYTRAIKLDPHFALAYAKLSQAHALMYWLGYDRTDTRLATARAMADTALLLAPKLAEAHVALGYCHYWGKLDYRGALKEFQAARAERPNDSDLLEAIGRVQRRQAQWKEAIASMTQAATLDPRSTRKLEELGATQTYLRRYTDAVEAFDRAIALAPDEPEFYADKALTHLGMEGGVDKGRQVLREALLRFDLPTLVPFLFWRSWGNSFLALLAVTAPDSLAAIRLGAFRGDTGRYLAYKVQLFRTQHRSALARVYADSMRLLEERVVGKRPQDPYLYAGLSLAYAALERRADAVRMGERAAALLPVSTDAVDGPYMVYLLAEIYAEFGRPDAAVERLRYLLSIPCPVSAALLRVDPSWNVLRSNPGFQRLVAGNS